MGDLQLSMLVYQTVISTMRVENDGGMTEPSFEISEGHLLRVTIESPRFTWRVACERSTGEVAKTPYGHIFCPNCLADLFESFYFHKTADG